MSGQPSGDIKLSYLNCSKQQRYLYWSTNSPFSIPSLAVIYWVLFIAYNIFLLITLFFYIKYGSNYMLRKRGFKACIASSILNLIVCSFVFCYEANYDFPHIPLIWIYNFFIPMFVIVTWVLRGLDLLQKFHCNRNKLLSLRNSKIDLETSGYSALQENEVVHDKIQVFDKSLSTGNIEINVPATVQDSDKKARSSSVQSLPDQCKSSTAIFRDNSLNPSSPYNFISSLNTPLNRKASLSQNCKKCTFRCAPYDGHDKLYNHVSCECRILDTQIHGRLKDENTSHDTDTEDIPGFVGDKNVYYAKSSNYDGCCSKKHPPSTFDYKYDEESANTANLDPFSADASELPSTQCQCRLCFWSRKICSLPVIRSIVFLFFVITKSISSLFTYKFFYMSKCGPRVFLLLLLVIHFAVSLFLHFRFSSPYNNSVRLSELYGPAIVATMAYTFIVTPVLLYQVTSITDAFGIKYDLLITFFVACPGFCILLLWTDLDLLQPLRSYIPSSFILLIGGSFIHCVIIVLPLLSAMFGEAHHCYGSLANLSPNFSVSSPHLPLLPVAKSDKKSCANGISFSKQPNTILSLNSLGHLSSVKKSLAKLNFKCSCFHQYSLEGLTLDNIFSDGLLLAKFRKFTITEFAVENLLFYEICKEYKQLWPASATMTNLPQNQHVVLNQNHVFSCSLEKTSELFHEPALQIYSKFIRSGSTYEININGRTKRKIEERIVDCLIYEDLFDEALEEVSQLLISWSLPRFLETLNESINQSFSKIPF